MHPRRAKHYDLEWVMNKNEELHCNRGGIFLFFCTWSSVTNHILKHNLMNKLLMWSTFRQSQYCLPCFRLFNTTPCFQLGPYQRVVNVLSSCGLHLVSLFICIHVVCCPTCSFGRGVLRVHCFFHQRTMQPEHSGLSDPAGHVHDVRGHFR